MNYMDEIKSLQVELQGVRREIVFLDHCGGGVRKKSDIKQTLCDLRVAISRLMERTKKEPTPHTLGVPVVGGFNLPRIETPTFDGNIFNWRLFWEVVQPALHDKPQLEEVDMLTFLWDVIKDGPAKNVI